MVRQIRSVTVRRDFRRARLGVLERRRAIREARRSAKAGQPLLPVTVDDNGRPAAPEFPFQETMRAQARQVSEQLIAWALEEHTELIQKIVKRAQTVVYHHDEVGDLDDAHLGRFQEALGEWPPAIGPQRNRAEAAVSMANQAVQIFWAVLVRRHILLREISRGGQNPPNRVPPPGVVDPGPPQPVDLTAWLPAKITLDPRWDTPEALLLINHYSSLERALEILKLRRHGK